MNLDSVCLFVCLLLKYFSLVLQVCQNRKYSVRYRIWPGSLLVDDLIPSFSLCVLLSLFVFTVIVVVHSHVCYEVVTWIPYVVQIPCLEAVSDALFCPFLFTWYLSSLKCFWSLQDLKNDNSLKQSYDFGPDF